MSDSDEPRTTLVQHSKRCSRCGFDFHQDAPRCTQCGCRNFTPLDESTAAETDLFGWLEYISLIRALVIVGIIITLCGGLVIRCGKWVYDLIFQ